MIRKRRREIVILAIIFMAGQLLGEVGQIKFSGNLLIPTASGEKQYKASLVITPAEIKIACSKKIFQPLNEFDSPWDRNILVNTAEIKKISVSDKKIYVIPEADFFRRYRNIFNPVVKLTVRWIYTEEEKEWAIIFVPDNPTVIGLEEKKLIDFINKRSGYKD